MKNLREMDNNLNDDIVIRRNTEKEVSQEQIHDLLFEEKLSWQAIIYDLINTEQLDPWNIDISLLANKYLEKLRELEEANFFISSKVLFAASLLLRIKSDILLNHDIPGLDDVLFGKKDKGTYSQERIELDEDVPELIPRTPLPRFRRVTLQELMESLGNAIKTENRRIKREIVLKQRAREAQIFLPKNVMNLREKIREVYRKLKEIFSDRGEKLGFSELVEKTKEEKLAAFVSLLHLDTQQRVWLEQDNHFDEIWIMLKSMYEKKNKALLEHQRKEVESFLEDEINEMELKHEAEVETGFSHGEIEGEMEE